MYTVIDILFGSDNMIKNKASLANTLATILVIIVAVLVLAAVGLLIRQWF